MTDCFLHQYYTSGFQGYPPWPTFQYNGTSVFQWTHVMLKDSSLMPTGKSACLVSNRRPACASRHSDFLQDGLSVNWTTVEASVSVPMQTFAMPAQPLYKGTGSLPGIKRPRRGADHPPPTTHHPPPTIHRGCYLVGAIPPLPHCVCVDMSCGDQESYKYLVCGWPCIVIQCG